VLSGVAILVAGSNASPVAAQPTPPPGGLTGSPPSSSSGSSEPVCYSDTKPGQTVKCFPCPGGQKVPSKEDCPSDDCQTISNCGIIKDYVNPGIKLLAALVGVASVISIVVAGIQYSSSGGEPAKASAAKNRIRNTIIALAVFALLYLGLNFLIPGGLGAL